ncbi:iron-containing alcohol dehydrogenase [Campylobacter blaseri]|uniref:NADH-dependent alcohol dehydrogenase n=1 Tax=Campylobacter blaseri TaxID=2042961 RepID=A0A2P8R3P3_9BACT|nr:iron-containing alcohol dehydrogenase [Campylobacter blaseri]PSM53122.1 NADH-dependent alcohol dehydrogenase [Campylobacter blaseri]PSM54588.1 NADH-dependent alcohol dehydrogenase [Campylobacter blaseri]QKF86939.1 iron-containing alcohol dehydrogenase [Campylobacter blaseri]
MENFSFCNPVRVEFGKDKEKNIGKYMSEFEAKKALIIYGSNRIKNSGLFDVVISSLKENGIEFTVCGGVKSNPVLSKVKEGIEIAKKYGADSILAVGGGSVLDSAKAISVGACYDGDVWDFFLGKKPVKALKIFDIITLAATGSEMNSGAVITNEDTLQKYSCISPVMFPKVSVINPELQKSVSREYLVYSASDVIAHSIEAYFTAKNRPNLINLQVEANIKTIMRTTEILLDKPDDYNARAEFAWAATMALNGLTHLGLGGYSFPNHMIEHAMSAVSDCPHGAGLSVIMPAWMMWYRDNNIEQFKRFAYEIFGLNEAKDGILALKKWFEKIGTPTKLSELKIEGEILDEVKNVAINSTKKYGVTEFYSKKVIDEIFELAK